MSYNNLDKIGGEKTASISKSHLGIRIDKTYGSRQGRRQGIRVTAWATVKVGILFLEERNTEMCSVLEMLSLKCLKGMQMACLGLLNAQVCSRDRD